MEAALVWTGIWLVVRHSWRQGEAATTEPRFDKLKPKDEGRKDETAKR